MALIEQLDQRVSAFPAPSSPIVVEVDVVQLCVCGHVRHNHNWRNADQKFHACMDRGPGWGGPLCLCSEYRPQRDYEALQREVELAVRQVLVHLVTRP